MHPFEKGNWKQNVMNARDNSFHVFHKTDYEIIFHLLHARNPQIYICVRMRTFVISIEHSDDFVLWWNEQEVRDESPHKRDGLEGLIASGEMIGLLYFLFLFSLFFADSNDFFRFFFISFPFLSLSYFFTVFTVANLFFVVFLAFSFPFLPFL